MIKNNIHIKNLLKEWNGLYFTKPLSENYTSNNIEFFIDFHDQRGSIFCKQLTELLREVHPPGRLAFLGNCASDYFPSEFKEILEDIKFTVETSRFKKYRLYLIDIQQDYKESIFKERAKLITQFIKEFK